MLIFFIDIQLYIVIKRKATLLSEGRSRPRPFMQKVLRTAAPPKARRVPKLVMANTGWLEETILRCAVNIYLELAMTAT